MPGSTLLLPPEKPAKKCGSIKPSLIKRSASAAVLLIQSSPPEGSIPRSTRSSLLSAWWLITVTLSKTWRPNRCSSSSGNVVRCIPAAISNVMRARGLPFLISSRSKGTVIRLGRGRVWSLVMITILSRPLANSLRAGAATGLCRPSLTISVAVRPDTKSAAAGASTRTFSSGSSGNSK